MQWVISRIEVPTDLDGQVRNIRVLPGAPGTGPMSSTSPFLLFRVVITNPICSSSTYNIRFINWKYKLEHVKIKKLNIAFLISTSTVTSSIGSSLSPRSVLYLISMKKIGQSQSGHRCSQIAQWVERVSLQKKKSLHAKRDVICVNKWNSHHFWGWNWKLKSFTPHVLN